MMTTGRRPWMGWLPCSASGELRMRHRDTEADVISREHLVGLLLEQIERTLAEIRESEDEHR